MFVTGEQARWFSPGNNVSGKISYISLFSMNIPFGHLLFKDPNSGIVLGIEIAEDADHAVTPGAFLALNGANIIINPSADCAAAGSSGIRNDNISSASRKNLCGYISASAGVHESTTDEVRCGHSIIAENGQIIAESSRFERENAIIYADIDFEMIRRERIYSRRFNEAAVFYTDPHAFGAVYMKPFKQLDVKNHDLKRLYEKNPFLPDSPLIIAQMCHEIFETQCAGLTKRLEHTQSAKSVIGISGGLDSTLALLVCSASHKLLGKSAGDILAVTMPGFGTTDKTHANALEIINLIGAEAREIPIAESVLKHFKDIGHDPKNYNVTYENAQARERTQILMNIANNENGIVIGTGDLSESALGWCTFNGDHMSMYNVNAGVPKTLIKHVLRWVIDSKLNGPCADKSFCKDNVALSYIIEDILNTPVSPELLPPGSDGSIVQKTEDSVGPYILNDFFIYYTVRHGMPPEKLFYIAKLAFSDDYTDETIKKWLSIFYKRFFEHQFKRNCMPDGPKTGSVCFSPRGSWSMPSDADYKLWAEEVSKL
jgi:NAD+ synthase (glutamine-hydrolysing)